ncbi:MAG: pirin family protein [Oligoflexales bacterium]|nr:pirin family protein [Oligoflexales bacterium]
MPHSFSIHKAHSRGEVNMGWLRSWHSFSFGSYYNPARMGFGCLRVINDDDIKPSSGFGTHPHANMEIVTVMLAGTLTHEDSMGNRAEIRAGEVQRMSAGTGIQHSEYNHSKDEAAQLLQIWVLPKCLNITPSYEQKSFKELENKSGFQMLVSPEGVDGSLSINQDAYFSVVQLKAGEKISYEKKLTQFPNNSGVYFFVINGEVQIESEKLSYRDAIAFESGNSFAISASTVINKDTSATITKILAIEVPMLLKAVDN